MILAEVNKKPTTINEMAKKIFDNSLFEPNIYNTGSSVNQYVKDIVGESKFSLPKMESEIKQKKIQKKAKIKKSPTLKKELSNL